MGHVTCLIASVRWFSSCGELSSSKEAQSTISSKPLVFIAFTLHITATMIPQRQFLYLLLPCSREPLPGSLFSAISATTSAIIMPDCGKFPVSNKQHIPFWNLLKFQVLSYYIISSSLPFLFCGIGVQISTEDTFIQKN
jgi:hypothetical protein